MNKKKSVISRIVSGIIAAFIMTILFSLCATPASAAEIKTVSAPAVVSVSVESPVMYAVPQLLMPGSAAIAIPDPFILAAAPPTSGGSGSGSATADSAYQSVINFFLVWIRRVGAVIALIGGIMFGLSIKNNDGEQKQAGILTMVAGFVVFAIALGADMFDLFS